MYIYKPVYAKSFEISLRKIVRSGRKGAEGKLAEVIRIIASGERLSLKYRDHKLLGEYEGYRECHVQPDLLLVYKIEQGALVLLLLDIGSHSYLFKK